jgi:hypothetical protein
MQGDKLRVLWEEHRAAGFPAELRSDLGGVEMVVVDAYIAGCVSSVVKTGRLSDPSHAEGLVGCRGDLRIVTPMLETEEAVAFCRRLVALMDAVGEVIREG